MGDWWEGAVRGKDYHAQLIMWQDFIMDNNQVVARFCPAHWLLTLFYKMGQNIENWANGRECGRVRSPGCLRDARGYWKMYGEAKAGVKEFSTEEVKVLKARETTIMKKFQNIAAHADS